MGIGVSFQSDKIVLKLDGGMVEQLCECAKTSLDFLPKRVDFICKLYLNEVVILKKL